MARTSRQLRWRERASILAALRPSQWAHFTVLPLAGFDPTLAAGVSVPALGRGLGVAALILGYGYLLNALSDRRLDRDRRKNPLVGREGPMIPHWLTAVGLALAALCLAVTGPWPVTVATAVALASGAVYSVGPRLKGWPGVCTLLNVGCFAPLLFTGLARDRVDPSHWALAAAFSGLLLQNQLIHEAADAPEDRAGGLRTTFLVAGSRGTALAIMAAGALVVASSIFLSDSRAVAWILALHAVPYLTAVPSRVAKHGGDAETMHRLRRKHRLASAVSGALLLAATVLDPIG